MESVKVYVQDATGHSTLDVSQDKLPGVVEDLLKKDMWVTTQKADNSTEILTKADLEPSDKLDEDDPEDDGEELSEEDKEIQGKSSEGGWASTLTGVKTTPAAKKFESRFENVINCTAINKIKGG